MRSDQTRIQGVVRKITSDAGSRCPAAAGVRLEDRSLTTYKAGTVSFLRVRQQPMHMAQCERRVGRRRARIAHLQQCSSLHYILYSIYSSWSYLGPGPRLQRLQQQSSHVMHRERRVGRCYHAICIPIRYSDDFSLLLLFLPGS